MASRSNKVVLAAIAVLLVLLVVDARGEDTPATPYHQRLSDDICHVLLKKRFPIGDCPTVWQRPNVPAVAIATIDGTVLNSEINNAPSGPEDVDADIAMHIHELLHRVDGFELVNGVTPEYAYWDPDQRYWEEAVVEACARDLLPSSVFIITGRVLSPLGGLGPYHLRVQRLRALTAAYTKGPWFSLPARSVRLWICRQDIETKMEAVKMLIAFKASQRRQHGNEKSRSRRKPVGRRALGPPDRVR